MELEYQIILRWINKTVLKEKIPSSSKIISLLSGGSLVKITPKSLKSADKKSETDNKFLELIGKSFGKDFLDRVQQLKPILSLMLLNRSKDKGHVGGGINYYNFILPIVVIIIGYSYIEKIGQDKFNYLVLVCLCYCIYLLVTDDSEDDSEDESEDYSEDESENNSEDDFEKKIKIYKNILDEKFIDNLKKNRNKSIYNISQKKQEKKTQPVLKRKLFNILRFFSFNLFGGAKPSDQTPIDQFGMLSMITQGIRWAVGNIKSYIKESISLTREWIKSPDRSFETFLILLTKVATGSKSNLSQEILNSYSFNGGTGHIEFLGNLPGRIETLITPKIKFYVTYNSKLGQNETKYFFNGLPMNTISYINSRPIATALVIGWIESTKFNSVTPEQIIAKSQFKYVFELNSDGKVIVYNRETNAEVQSIQTSIDLWLGSNPTQAKISATQVCKEMFDISTGLDNPICSQYFYSVLGRSALSMVKILGKQVETSSDIKNLLISTNPGIKYEILKKLGWKINSSNKLIGFDDWIKTQPIEFSDYFKTKPGLEVKSILEGYVQDIETHLKNDLKQDISNRETNVTPIQKNRIKRLTSSQVAALRSIQIDQTAKLIKDKETYNIKGIILPKYINMSGGENINAVSEIETKFNFIKFQLAGGNKKISPNTETKINLLIQSVSSLEQLNSPLYPTKLIKLNKIFSKLEDYLK